MDRVLEENQQFLDLQVLPLNLQLFLHHLMSKVSKKH